MIVLLVIASLVVRYLPRYHTTSPHPELNIPCEADLLLPYIGVLLAQTIDSTLGVRCAWYACQFYKSFDLKRWKTLVSVARRRHPVVKPAAQATEAEAGYGAKIWRGGQ